MYYIEEEQRRGELYPVLETDTFTSILSSRDIRMIDHLDALLEAGVNGLKIEGRMKSAYYTAVVTRAYRKRLDSIVYGVPSPEEASVYAAELNNVSRREPSTGFYFGREEIERPTKTEYRRDYTFIGVLGEEVQAGLYRLHLKNRIARGLTLELIGPHLPSAPLPVLDLFSEEGTPIEAANHTESVFLRPGVPADAGHMLRAYRPNAPN